MPRHALTPRSTRSVARALRRGPARHDRSVLVAWLAAAVARPLRDPAVGATAHARLSDGTINTVTEYDAKPAFGGTVYFMSNTTSVFVGGIARGMVRVGTPISTVDRLRGCDPNSDGTLTWRYVAIHTGKRSRPRLYGWLPARCRGAGSTPPPATTPSQAS